MFQLFSVLFVFEGGTLPLKKKKEKKETEGGVNMLPVTTASKVQVPGFFPNMFDTVLTTVPLNLFPV